MLPFLLCLHIGSSSSRPSISQDTFTPLHPVRRAPEPPGPSQLAPDIPPRPPATKKSNDTAAATHTKTPLKPPAQACEISSNQYPNFICYKYPSIYCNLKYRYPLSQYPLQTHSHTPHCPLFSFPFLDLFFFLVLHSLTLTAANTSPSSTSSEERREKTQNVRRRGPC